MNNDNRASEGIDENELSAIAHNGEDAGSSIGRVGEGAGDYVGYDGEDVGHVGEDNGGDGEDNGDDGDDGEDACHSIGRVGDGAIAWALSDDEGYLWDGGPLEGEDDFEPEREPYGGVEAIGEYVKNSWNGYHPGQERSNKRSDEHGRSRGRNKNRRLAIAPTNMPALSSALSPSPTRKLRRSRSSSRSRSRSRRRRRSRLNRPLAGVIFLLPGLAGFSVFYIWPFCVSLYYSLLSRPINGVFVGVKNYVEMFQNLAYLKGLTNTARFIGISVPISMALSLIIALMIRDLFRGKELFTLVFLVPLVIPSGSIVTFWRTLLARDGVLNGILQTFGIGKINWLDSSLTFWVIVAIFTWKNLGFNMVLFISGLGNIPVEYYEAARVDGARPSQVFFRITAPQLAASAVLVLILSIVNSFKVFKEIYLITGSYPHESIYTLQHFMNNMFASLNYPKLTTATTILVVLIAALTQGLLRLERKAAD